VKRRLTGKLTVAQILAWADAHHDRTGKWPNRQTGTVHGGSGETWLTVDDALRYGYRGLPSGSSLPRLLADQRGVPNRLAKPRLTRALILEWADAHRSRTGRWPNSKSGPVEGVSGETWKGVDLALRQGWRGLRRGPSLAQLLAQVRRARNRVNLPRLTEAKILIWADEHYRLTGAWPTQNSGPVAGAVQETWGAITSALRDGYRGLPGGTTLARLLNAKRRRRGQR
jgi:hypothetical protein